MLGTENLSRGTESAPLQGQPHMNSTRRPSLSYRAGECVTYTCINLTVM